MRLFSEKVVPTFTSSNLNILTVEDFQEVFFDVFEFEINGKKFVAEKVSEYKGSPVVDIPLVLEGKEFTAPFVLQTGKFEILFNKNNSTFVREIVVEQQEPVIEYADKDDEVEEIIFEKKEDILREIAQARQSAEKYVEKLKQQKLNEAALYFDEKKKSLDAEINESKKDLFNEFLSIVNNVKSEFFEFNEEERERLSSFIESSITELSTDLANSISQNQKAAEHKFSEKINELATNILSGVLLKEIDSNNKKTISDVNERFESVSNNIRKLIDSNSKQIEGRVNNKLNDFNNAIVNLEKINIELNDQINKGDNKALSRIGNVKTQLEEAIANNTSAIISRLESAEEEVKELHTSKAQLEESIIDSASTLLARVDEAENKIRTFYDDKISLIEEKVEDLTSDNKQYFLSLVNESKQSLLNEIANIKVDVPNIVIEKSNGKQEVDLKGIKSELEKIIGTRFSNELQSLKRLIEMSSGGGSVAKQFAAGGTMEGSLNVTGQYLSGGVDLLTIFAGGGDDIEVNTVVRSSSANWNNAYNTGTVYQSNSASNATIDFANSKFFPLSGGTITGATVINNNLTVNGNLTATGTTTFNNTVFSVTSALSVVHVGEGPAVWIGNSGQGDIASFYDIDQNIEVFHIGGNNGSFPNVGVKTSTPNVDFTVNGQISASGDISTAGSITGNNIVYTTGDQTIAGNKTFSNNVTHNGLLKATAQNTLSGTVDTDVITRSLLDSSFGEQNRCIYVTANAIGGTQTTTQFAAQGSLSWGSAPVSGSSMHVLLAMPNIIVHGNSLASNTGGQGNILDWRVNHAAVFPITTPFASSTARDIEIRIYNGSCTLLNSSTRLGTLATNNGYGIVITKHPVNNTYILRLVCRTTTLGGANITSATNTSPIVITQNFHGLLTGDTIEILNVGGNTAANGVFTIQNVTTNTFELVGSTGNGAYTSGGAAQRITSSSIEISPQTSYVFCLKWTFATKTISLHLNNLDQPAVLSIDRVGTPYNISFHQTAGLRIGYTSITDTTPFNVLTYGVPLMFKI